MYREMMNEVPVRGNLVPDAHLAVILKQHGVKTLWSRDRDFLKFPFLKLKDPFAVG
jgi:predicted nucleic acid-binding protein